MKSIQIEYDRSVQNRNKLEQITKLQKKLDRLETIKKQVYIEGQKDKKRNHRETTLFEYKQNVQDYERQIKDHKNKINNISSSLRSPVQRTAVMSPKLVTQSKKLVKDYITQEELEELKELEELDNKIIYLIEEIRKLKSW